MRRGVVSGFYCVLNICVLMGWDARSSLPAGPHAPIPNPAVVRARCKTNAQTQDDKFTRVGEKGQVHPPN